MLQLLFLVVAIYMFMVFQLLQPNVAVVVSVLLHVFLFRLSVLFDRGGASQDGRERVVRRGLAGGGAGAGGRGVLWPWRALGMQHACRGRGADATGCRAIWGRTYSRDT